MQVRHTTGSESSSLPTPKARDAQAEGYEAGLRRSQPQVGTIVKGLVEGDKRVTEDGLFRTPSVTDSTGGARSEKQASERGQMVKTADQVVQLAFENGLKVSPAVEASLLPTPVVNDMGAGKSVEKWDEWTAEVKAKHNNGNGHGASLNIEMLRLLPTPQTMDSLPARTPEKIAESKLQTPAGYSNLRESVVNDLLPTTRSSMGNASQPEVDAGDPKKRIENTVLLLPTPTAVDNNTVAKSELDNDDPKHRLKVTSQVLARDAIGWGKFEPAIRRWEQTINRPAPAPTKPDGKDGAHRLSSKFTEWMMGLPDGWITDCGLTRNEELKACGNGVVPQQAELALRLLLDDLDLWGKIEAGQRDER